MNGFKILRAKNEVSEYVRAVRSASDANTHALGFLQSQIFDRHAQEEKLLVAVDGRGAYSGHLLFDYSFPRAAVMQIFCVPAVRKQGIARALVEDLKRTLSEDGFMSIRASVAEDLIESNRFWESMGFYVGRKRPGGATTKRTILQRIHELDSPQLFARSGLTLRPDNLLGLGFGAASAAPVYLIDLNVVFDVAHGRLHAPDAEKLLHASHSGECRVLISGEMADELQRHTRDAGSDPMLRLIRGFPRVLAPKESGLTPLEARIAAIVFPEKAFPQGLSSNDRSDIRHLLTALKSGATAFVTRDNRLLDASSRLEADYGLRVLSPNRLWDFMSAPQINSFESSGSGFIEVSTISDLTHECCEFLSRCGVSEVDVATLWSRPSGALAMLVRGDKGIAGVSIPGSFDVRSKSGVIRVAISEESGVAPAVARVLLRNSCAAAADKGLGLIRLEMPAGQTSLKETAFTMGFRSDSTGVMTKGILHRVVANFNWAKNRKSISDLLGVSIPDDPPKWRGPGQLLELGCADGERRHVAVIDFETLLSPALICLEGRPATIASIRPKYSEVLLGNHMQLSLAPQMDATTHSERLFLSAPKLLNQFVRGGLLFFYQSGDRGAQAVIAVARIVDANLIKKDAVSEESLRRSVFNSDNLAEIGKSEDKTACLFDSLIFLPCPVTLESLREIGYQSARLTSVGRLSGSQAAEIIRRGFSCD